MNPIKKFYCRAFQTVMHSLIPVFPYREPELLGSFDEMVHIIKNHSAKGETAGAEIEYLFPTGEKLRSWYTLDRDGMSIKVSGSETVRILLPAFKFNGKDYSKITLKDGVLEIEFEGYVCRYTVLDGTIIALDRPARNRNGHYESYAAEGCSGLRIRISIEKL